MFDMEAVKIIIQMLKKDIVYNTFTFPIIPIPEDL